MADKHRINRTAVAALASLSLAAVACGSSSPVPAIGDGGSDAGAGRDAATRSDALPPVPDGSLDADGGVDGGVCPVPLAPDLSVIANDEVLKFVAADGLPIELAVLPAAASISTAVFQSVSSLSLAALHRIRVRLPMVHLPGPVRTER